MYTDETEHKKDAAPEGNISGFNLLTKITAFLPPRNTLSW
jgi:hypothetical protein